MFIQDADLGYDPAGYPHLLEAIYSSYADVVLGPRFLGGSHRVLYFWHYLANRLLTLLSHVFRGLNLTDMKARHKAVRRGLLARMNFSSDQFGIEPELTAKAARLQARIHSRRQQNWLERWSFRHILIIPG